MSLLFDVVFASFARSTHHKMALDALRQLRHPQAAAWKDVFLFHHRLYLEGAKAPDDEFKDFKNHVLHVGENDWGGARQAAEEWYALCVSKLRAQQFADAVYAAGVMGHYVSDPFMPLHTGQTEAEGSVHRALEWSVTKSYAELRRIIDQDLGGFPPAQVGAGSGWLGQAVRSGAVFAHAFYNLVIDHYNLAAGTKNPQQGMDQECKHAIAQCIARSVAMLTAVLDRALGEANATPPAVSLSLPTVLATVQVPVATIVNGLADQRDRATVEAIYAEVKQTGKALHSLPEDDRAVRKLHAAEVLHKPLAELDAERPRPSGQKFGQGLQPPPSDRVVPIVRHAPDMRTAAIAASSPPPRLPTVRRTDLAPIARSTPSPTPSPRSSVPFARAAEPVANAPSPQRKFYLQRGSAIVDAPSIGAKTAARLQAVGVGTVQQLLEADPKTLVDGMKSRHITARTIRQWQAEAGLVCCVPGLRGHDAQLLVALEIDEPKLLTGRDPQELFAAVTELVQSKTGERILRGATPPDLEEVTGWIAAAGQARSLQAA